MPKSKQKFCCYVCNKLISASAMMNHIKARHHIEYESFYDEACLVITEHETKECVCGKLLKRKQNWLNAILLAKLQSRDLHCHLNVVCDSKCRDLLEPWNYGLTKHDHDSIMKISNSRLGDKNPIHKLMSDPEKYEKWRINLKNANVGWFMGVSLVEKLGVDAASLTREKMSKSAKLRKVHGHTGHKHSEATKRILSQKTAENISNTKKFVSSVQQNLYENLSKKLEIGSVFLEYQIGPYSIDIVYKNFAIEVDGDFWHVNEKKGFKITYDCQKRNLLNDARKEKFLRNNGWKLIRVWESDIKENIDIVIKEILNEISQNN